MNALCSGGAASTYLAEGPCGTYGVPNHRLPIVRDMQKSAGGHAGPIRTIRNPQCPSRISIL
jgi:hypothetical protein